MPQNGDNHDYGSDTDSATTPSTPSSTDSGPDTDHSSDSDANPDSDSNTNPDSDSNTSSSLESDSDHESGPDGDSDSNAGSGPGGEGESEVSHAQAWQEIASTIAGAQKRHIRHEAAEVAASATPFLNADELQAYTLALAQGLESHEYPAGFGLTAEYDSVESYKTGRSLKPLVIPLPYEVWFPRIVVWCKALDLLKRLSICRDAPVSPE